MKEPMYWQVKVQVRLENEKGKLQKVTEIYLVNAVSTTDAEAKIYKQFEGSEPFEITAITKSKVLFIIE